jgi:hypothetical protein
LRPKSIASQEEALRDADVRGFEGCCQNICALNADAVIAQVQQLDVRENRAAIKATMSIKANAISIKACQAAFGVDVDACYRQLQSRARNNRGDAALRARERASVFVFLYQ